jgi:hypothetical protein
MSQPLGAAACSSPLSWTYGASFLRTLYTGMVDLVGDHHMH